MKSIQKLKCFTLVLAVSVLCACVGTPFTLDTPTGKYDMQKGRQINASACGFQLFLLIPIVTNQRHAIAYRSLVRQAGDDFIGEVRVQEKWTYAFVGTVYCTVLDAIAYPKLES